MSTILPAPATELHRVFEMLLRTADMSNGGPAIALRDMLEAVERAALHDALMRTRGNRARAARLLGTTERVFNYSVRKYGIDWRKFRG
jgi:Nif-specific regulatory protein